MATAPTKLPGIIGPFKVTAYDKKSRLVEVENADAITLGDKVKDEPKVGRNYAFQIDLKQKIATAIYLFTVDIVVHTEKEILMIQRKNNPFAGRMALPGGFVDPGETFIQAALRELREETGLSVSSASKIKYIGKFDKKNRDPRMENCVSFSFSCAVEEGAKDKITAGDDASMAGWIAKDKINSMMLAFDHKDIIKKSGVLK